MSIVYFTIQPPQIAKEVSKDEEDCLVYVEESTGRMKRMDRGQVFGLIPLGTTAVPGLLQLAASGDATPGLAVNANDPRGFDAREPLPHQHGAVDIITGGGTIDPGILGTGPTDSEHVLFGDSTWGEPVGITARPTLGGDARVVRIEADHDQGITIGIIADGGAEAFISAEDASTTQKGVVLLSPSGGSASGLAVQASDKQLVRATTAAGPATTTQLPSSGMIAIHKNTSSGAVTLAYNDSGVIKSTVLS